MGASSLNLGPEHRIALEKAPGGDLFVRSGPGSVRLAGDDVDAYIAGRFG